MSAICSWNDIKTVLLDVRTEDEWNTVGKPDTKDLGIKSYFITMYFPLSRSQKTCQFKMYRNYKKKI